MIFDNKMNASIQRRYYSFLNINHVDTSPLTAFPILFEMKTNVYFLTHPYLDINYSQSKVPCPYLCSQFYGYISLADRLCELTASVIAESKALCNDRYLLV